MLWLTCHYTITNLKSIVFSTQQSTFQHPRITPILIPLKIHSLPFVLWPTTIVLSSYTQAPNTYPCSLADRSLLVCPVFNSTGSGWCRQLAPLRETYLARLYTRPGPEMTRPAGQIRRYQVPPGGACRTPCICAPSP